MEAEMVLIQGHAFLCLSVFQRKKLRYNDDGGICIVFIVVCAQKL